VSFKDFDSGGAACAVRRAHRAQSKQAALTGQLPRYCLLELDCAVGKAGMVAHPRLRKSVHWMSFLMSALSQLSHFDVGELIDIASDQRSDDIHHCRIVENGG